MTYSAHVAKITKISPIEKADNIVASEVLGHTVITSKSSSVVDQLGVYFPVDGQLSQEFCDANDLIARKDENGIKLNGGYFSEKRKISAQTFRGVKSDGFFVPLSYFDFVLKGLDFPLKEGDTFTELNGVPICNKYFSKQTLNEINQKKGKVQKLERVKINFPKHFDTQQFRFVKDKIKEDSKIIITEKFHGTSVRVANTEHQYILPFYKRWLNKIYPFFIEKEIKYILGTRNAVLKNNKNDPYSYYGGFYGDGQPYDLAIQKTYGKLYEEEIIYGELVGFVHGKPLFEHDLTKTKELQKRFKKTNMIYSYGLTPETGAELYVYRIVQNGRELSWDEVKSRCVELNIKHVPEVEGVDLTNIEDKLEMLSTLDNSHISEGFCIREEFKDGGMAIYKHKSFNFKVLEGIIKEVDDNIDIEEVS